MRFGVLYAVLLCLAVQCVAPAASIKAQPCSVECVELRCEYLDSPLGIDIAQPRLSWKLQAADPDSRGWRQQAYRIIVASSRDVLDRDRGDLWDSGFVKSGQSVNVTYAGKPLQSAMECHWKVSVKDDHGVISPWSEPARWTMGLLNASDWKGQWIGSDQIFERQQGWPPPDNTVADPWFRKTFTLAKQPQRAVIHIASVGYHELYVNGRKIGDAVLSAAVANHRKRARYVTYEIADQLKPGQNVFALWLGMSWSIFPQYKTPDRPQTAIAIAQAQIDSGNGDSRQIVTDATWKTHPSCNTLLGVWDFMHFGGECYDARNEIRDWSLADFDDSDWKPATVYNPKLTLSAEMIQPNRRIKKITPVKIEKQSDGAWRADLGVNMTGLFEMDVAGKPGDTVELSFSERENEPMTHRLHSRYIIGPDGKGTFSNRFNYFTGRWVRIEGLKAAPQPRQIRCYMVRTDYKRAASFECSNELLNKIYDTTLWTYENLSLGGYVVDCAHRERMGYGGDGHATTETGLDNFGTAAFYTKWTQDWRDVQGRTSVWGSGAELDENSLDDGNLPYTAPTYWGGGGPAWSGFCVTLPWEIHNQYGDMRILSDNYPTMQRWLAFVETKSKDDMLVRWGGEWDFLGDWLWPGAEGVNGDTVETLFFNNCYWIYNLQTAAKIADRLGHAEDARKYRSRAQEVRRAVHAKFFDPSENGYVNNLQAYLAVALLVQLPPEEVRPKVWKRFEDEILVHRKGHFWGGITGGYFVTKTLLEYNRPDLMYEMVSKETYPGWGDMLKKGATTIWEAWDGHNSLMHSSYLYVGAWFIEGLGGITSGDEPGFEDFVIRPALIRNDALTWVKARYECNYGLIRSDWKLEGKNVLFDILVPANTTATFYLPTSEAQSVTEGGGRLAEAAGIKALGEQGGCVVLRLGPGRYQFKAKGPL